MATGKFTCYKLPFVLIVLLAAFNWNSNSIVSITSLASSTDRPSQKIDNADSVVLFPIYNAQGIGYMDKTGRVVIPPQFHNAKGFSEGLARVEIDGKWGFIDKTGAVVIKPQFELVSVGNEEDASAALDFHEGMAVVGRVEGPWKLTQKWGYIDRTGRIAIPIQYDSAGPFSEGLAPIGELYTEKKGNLITEGGRSLGYLDKTGKIVLKPGMDSGLFIEGLALAEINPFSDDSKKGYIDKTGKFVIQPRSWEAYDFSEGFARVRKATTDEWGFIDRTGKIVISMIYDDARNFTEGFAAIKTHDLWGFIDKSGRIQIKPEYIAVGNFSEGLACACVADQNPDNPFPICGYIDPKGNWVIKPAFQIIVSDFRNGLAFVVGKSGVGYINSRGEFVWKGTTSLKSPGDEKQKFRWTVNGCSVLSDEKVSGYPCKLDFKLF